MKEPRFYIVAWAGRRVRNHADYTKYHLVDRQKDSLTFDGEITACGRLALWSAFTGRLDWSEAADEYPVDNPSDLERVTCRACQRTKIFQAESPQQEEKP